MNVVGFSSSSFSVLPDGSDSGPSMARASNFALARRSNSVGPLTQPSRWAKASITSNPTLWRGAAGGRARGARANNRHKNVSFLFLFVFLYLSPDQQTPNNKN